MDLYTHPSHLRLTYSRLRLSCLPIALVPQAYLSHTRSSSLISLARTLRSLAGAGNEPPIPLLLLLLVLDQTLALRLVAFKYHNLVNTVLVAFSHHNRVNTVLVALATARSRLPRTLPATLASSC